MRFPTQQARAIQYSTLAAATTYLVSVLQGPGRFLARLLLYVIPPTVDQG